MRSAVAHRSGHEQRATVYVNPQYRGSSSAIL